MFPFFTGQDSAAISVHLVDDVGCIPRSPPRPHPTFVPAFGLKLIAHQIFDPEKFQNYNVSLCKTWLHFSSELPLNCMLKKKKSNFVSWGNFNVTKIFFHESHPPPMSGYILDGDCKLSLKSRYRGSPIKNLGKTLTSVVFVLIILK